MTYVFALFVTFALGSDPQRMGLYKTLAECTMVAKAYTHASCKALDADDLLYGTCWGCMHGCSPKMNIEICGTDPRPK